jgi:hypothetical protein
MASCEKCWRDSGGDPYKYERLIVQRNNNPCSPEDQAGESATECPICKRKTVHQYAKSCVICGYNIGVKK